MKNMLKMRIAWIWALALLALPNCADIIGLEPWEDPPGNLPSILVFCDIPKPPPEAPQCIAPGDVGIGIRQNAAAIELNTGGHGTLTIDESSTALADCAATTGGPQSVSFLTQFPQGEDVCAKPNSFTTADAVCVAECTGEVGDSAWCGTHAHASTNVPVTGYPGGCSGEGVKRLDFEDPRIFPVAVEWDPASQIGVTPTGDGGIQRTSASDPNNPQFDAGAASAFQIDSGDAYIEFSAGENDINLSHVIGLAEIPDGCSPCTDTDPSLADISFSLSMNYDNHVYVIENGAVVATGPDINGSFGTYNPVERYRVSIEQSGDGSKTAIVRYSRLTAECFAGNPCQGDPIWTSDHLAHYPLRVDVSFREDNALLSKVTVVRIQ